jgi:anti-anti-sigma regulatory factor
MSIQRWSEDVILVDLPETVGKHHELQKVIAMLREEGACDVVVDFSHVHVVGGTWLAQLQKIQRLAQEGGHRLTLCNLAPATRGIFTIARLDHLFEFAEDAFTALAAPQLVG